MAALLLLLLISPALVAASIDVDIKGAYSEDLSGIKVKLAGRQVHSITDKQVAAFNLVEEILKRGVLAYTGQNPADAYVRAPTPWGDLYHTYNWQQVFHTLEPRAATILSAKQEPTSLLSRRFENQQVNAAIVDISVPLMASNNVSTRTDDNLPIDSIDYKIHIQMMGDKPLTFTSAWGDKTATYMLALGKSKRVAMLLQPKQAVLTELRATKVNMQLEIPFKSTLHGSVATHFEQSFHGHDFWAFPVEKVMKSAKVTPYLIGKQIVDIAFYVNPKVVVTDAHSGVFILEYKPTQDALPTIDD